MRYTSNSLSVENVHWSFLFATPPALTLGYQCRYMFKKVIQSISHMLDSQGVFLCFSVAKSRYHLGIPYRTAWHHMCCYVFNLKVPLTPHLGDRFKDWAVPGSTKDWWTTHTFDFYALVRTSHTVSARCASFWQIYREESWWVHRLAQNWSQSLDLKARVFMWRMLIGALLLATVLQARGFTDGLCPRCSQFKETARSPCFLVLCYNEGMVASIAAYHFH